MLREQRTSDAQTEGSPVHDATLVSARRRQAVDVVLQGSDRGGVRVVSWVYVGRVAGGTSVSTPPIQLTWTCTLLAAYAG